MDTMKGYKTPYEVLGLTDGASIQEVRDFASDHSKILGFTPSNPSSLYSIFSIYKFADKRYL